MAELKTKLNDKSVRDFLNTIENEQKRLDSFELLHIMEEISGQEAKMWGESIVGFGNYRYIYSSGKEMDWFSIGFSPRKQNLTIYLIEGFNKYEVLFKQLGKYKTSVACLYINKLSDVDLTVLKKIISAAFKDSLTSKKE